MTAYVSTKKKIDGVRLLNAVSDISGIDVADIFLRNYENYSLSPRNGQLSVFQRDDMRNGSFKNRLTVGSIFLDFSMPCAEFGPKLAVALGEEVLFDDDLDESDSEEYPFYVATPDGKRHRAHYDESGEIVY